MIEFLQNASIYWLLCIVFFDWDMILRLRDLLASFYLYGRNLKNGRKQLKQLQREQSRKECVTMRYLFSHLKGQEALFAGGDAFILRIFGESEEATLPLALAFCFPTGQRRCFWAVSLSY